MAASITKRQRQIVTLVSQGLSSREIADNLGVSKSNIDKTVFILCRTLQVQSRASLAAYCAKNNLLLETVG